MVTGGGGLGNDLYFWVHHDVLFFCRALCSLVHFLSLYIFAAGIALFSFFLFTHLTLYYIVIVLVRNRVTSNFSSTFASYRNSVAVKHNEKYFNSGSSTKLFLFERM